ncbi:beta-fructosidase [Nodosilinea sp. E11]|uniref:beta-fructosidase n=1 Tax=Nodosilinea sp. E11 TaxID=3037479 RepID=UPI00293491B4|nr:beta-fructosidase [Nodosilinea sp. E11]WOD40628.1 beta-fructosidase [Nodosilinea sp. E11]
MPPAVRHPSRHVWDFWYHFDHETQLFHLFYLNADHGLVSTAQHHYAACVGHATTSDFVTIDWGDDQSYDVLHPPANHWANTCLWSGDVIQLHNGYLMFYTSRDRHQDDGLTQSIGVAYTDDLWSHQWQFFDTQLKPNFGYQTKGVADDLTIHAWRDPFLFRHRDRGQIFMLVSAKALNGPLGQSGVVGLLQVADDHFTEVVRGAREWEYLTPLLEPCGYAEMEVPQLYRQAQGRYELVFSCWAKYDFSPGTGGAGGLHGVTLPQLWTANCDRAKVLRSHPANYVLSPEAQGLYACRIVPELGGEIIGFDSQQGGIRRSGLQTGWAAMDRNFSDLAV